MALCLPSEINDVFVKFCKGEKFQWKLKLNNGGSERFSKRRKFSLLHRRRRRFSRLPSHETVIFFSSTPHIHTCVCLYFLYLSLKEISTVGAPKGKIRHCDVDRSKNANICSSFQIKSICRNRKSILREPGVIILKISILESLRIN